MKIDRIIFIFEKEKNTVFKQINAADLNIVTIKKIFKPGKDDPKFYRPCKIEEEHYAELLKYKKELINYPLNKFDLYLETVSIK